MRPRHVVLCVDDQPRELDAMQFVLETRGRFRVIACRSAKEALAVLQRGTAARLVVAELSMASVDGNELCRQVRRRFPDVATVLVSATVEAFERGNHADRFLPKGALSAANLLDACVVLALRKRGPKRPNSVRTAAAQGGTA